MTLSTLLLSLIFSGCIAVAGVIMYDYFNGKITGPMAWAFMCITISIMGLSGIQLIT